MAANPPVSGPADPLDAALQALGYAAFRPWQRAAIETLLQHGRLLLVAPTGGGKSLTYQLPAVALPGTTLVVSPLIALMHDQVASLQARGIAATYLASTLDHTELRARMEGLAQGRYRLAYVAPERLAHPGFRALLERLDCPLVAIDEAHCISEWGHDFRPEYLQIGEVVRSLPRARARVLACTATATPVVRDEILARLGLPPHTPQVLRGFARPNLTLRAIEVAGGAARASVVDGALREAVGRRGQGAAIVYAPTRKGAEAEAERLSRTWRSAAYHAGRPAEEREAVLAAFLGGALDVVVATNAFGMGIDRADVRAVIHLAPPGSIEAYYQEVGRAGRDGGGALGVLLWSAKDMAVRRALLERETDGVAPPPEVVEHKWGLFLELMRWAEGDECRHDAILRYFGDDEEALGGCGRCDACVRANEAGEALDGEAADLLVRKVLSGVARIDGRFGLSAAVKLLTGRSDERLQRAGLAEVKTFGVLASEPEAYVKRVLQRCVTAGWVVSGGGERPVARLTDEGRAVMAGRKPAGLRLPARARSGGPSVAGATTRRATAESSVADDAPTLARFEALRAHRLEAAREAGVPPYVIASDRTLRDLAQRNPATLAELPEVHGIGPSKVERFGQAWLDVLARVP